MVYVKLFGSILDSSIWAEDHATVRIFITLLAMADKHGAIHAVESGLARRANATLEETRAALKKLEAPDLETSTQEYGGRRVERVEGGWILLNYEKYREIRTDDQLKAAARQRRAYYKKRETSRTSRTEAEAEADADAETPKTTALSRDRRSGDRRTPGKGLAVKETGDWVSEAIKEAGAEDFTAERIKWETMTVFAFWHYRAGKNGKVVILTADRKARISRWLKIYGLEDCLLAVEGAFHHPDHNQQDRNYHELENIFKAREGTGTIEKLRDAGQHHARQVKAIIGKLTAKGWRPSE